MIKQQPSTSWESEYRHIAAFTSVSFIMDSKLDASTSSHIVGLLWPRHHVKPEDQKTNSWEVDCDLTVYECRPGSKKQHLVKRNDSDYRWAENSVAVKQSLTQWTCRRTSPTSQETIT